MYYILLIRCLLLFLPFFFLFWNFWADLDFGTPKMKLFLGVVSGHTTLSSTYNKISNIDTKCCTIQNWNPILILLVHGIIIMVFLKGVARQSRTMIVLPVLVVVKVHRPVDVAKLYCNRRRKSQTQKYRYTFRSFLWWWRRQYISYSICPPDN